MAEVVNIVDQRGSREHARKLLDGRFVDVVDDMQGGGWTALCPCCDTTARIVITRNFMFCTCPNGHTAGEIMEATEPKPPPEHVANETLERVRTLQGATLSEIEALDLPPPEWLVEGFVEQSSFGVVFGPPNAGKTFFAIHVICLAASLKWRVKFIEAESSLFHIRKRLLRAADAICEVNKGNINISWCAPLDISQERGYDDLVSSIRGYDLCVLDSMAALSGGVSENEEAWARVSNHLAWARSITDCAILGLHHSTKEAWTPGQVPELRHLRGHGALAGRADYAFGIVPGPEEDGRVVFDLHDLKEREGGKQKPQRCKIDMISSAAHFEIKEIEGPKPLDHQFLAQIESLVPVACDHRLKQCMSKRKLENIVGGRAQQVRRAVDQLEHSGRIKLLRAGCYTRVPTLGTHQNGTDAPGRTSEDLCVIPST